MTQTAEILESLPPAQAQPGGLAQFDLAVTATPLVINWNRDAVSALLDATLEQYEGLVVPGRGRARHQVRNGGAEQAPRQAPTTPARKSPARLPGRWTHLTPKPRHWSSASSKSAKA